MAEMRPTDNQEILDRIYSAIFHNRLRDYVDSDDGLNVLQDRTFDLTESIQRLLVDDAPSSIENEDVEKILGADDFRDHLFQAITELNNPHHGV
ncbi:hypothetical protein F1728_04345 [Gimesia benthica]|uniref:Uncharacterized protein n=1 Tax=Gimesia benthica TaxID=2608982 RepID=A0A6I6A7B8_9PLAN|nr:hypothetical protein [Gimesia benthica]QGQ21966.1 hypothetical protein F1728_04345 [Gimesia benthica]